MEFLQYENVANNADCAITKANFRNIAEESKKKLNKIYALIINQDVFESFNNHVSEGYQIKHTILIENLLLCG